MRNRIVKDSLYHSLATPRRRCFLVPETCGVFFRILQDTQNLAFPDIGDAHITERTQGVTHHRKYINPVIGNIPVDEIGKRENLAVIEPLWEPHAAIAVDMLCQMRGVLNYAAFHGWRDPTAPNPCEWTGNLEHALPPNTRHEVRVHRPSAHWTDMADIMRELQVLEDSRS
jgi:Phage integrase central domain